MSQQTAVGAAAAAARGMGCAVGSGGKGGQAVKRQPPPTTIRKQTYPATTPTTRMYTSLSLCLLRATCASDVAMICIEVWHKKQNTSCQPGKGPARQQQQEEEEAGCGAELCAACFYDTYATLWFGPQVTRAVGGGDLYLYTHSYICE